MSLLLSLGVRMGAGSARLTVGLAEMAGRRAMRRESFMIMAV